MCFLRLVHFIHWHFHDWHQRLNGKKFFNFIFIWIDTCTWLVYTLQICLFDYHFSYIPSQNCLKYFTGVHISISQGTGLNTFSLANLFVWGGFFFLHQYTSCFFFFSFSVSGSLNTIKGFLERVIVNSCNEWKISCK